MSEGPTQTSGSKSQSPQRSADGAAPSEAEAKAAVEPVTFREKLEAGGVLAPRGDEPADGSGALAAGAGDRLTNGAGAREMNIGGKPAAQDRTERAGAWDV